MKQYLPSIAVVVVILALCLGVWFYFGMWQLFEPSLTVEQEALEASNNLLESLRPTSRPGSLVFPCNEFLHDKLAQGNHFSLMLKEAYSHDDPDGGPAAYAIGRREAFVLVTFADGSKAELYFYNGRYESCEIIDQ